MIEPRRLLVVMAVVYGVTAAAVGAYVVLTDRAETVARVYQSTQSYASLLESQLAASDDAAAAVRLFRHNLDLASSAEVGVGTLGGDVLAREPPRQADIGQLAALARTTPTGTFREWSPGGDVERVVSYRVSQPGQDVVWVSVGAEDALASWRARAERVLLLGSASMLVMAGLTVLLARELARQRRAADALVAVNSDLERSNADLEQFAYIASHDLKEPLRNIASYVQLLQRRYEGKLDPDADAFIGYTVDGVRRMQAIINELLAYSRVGTGKLTMSQVQAGVSVSTALAQLKTVISEAQAAVEIKGPLPVVMADPPQLASLFQNLIGNGIKYRRPETRPEITVGVVDQDAEWAFYVADNGIGIESQYHDQIFDLFKRLHARDRYTGTGIGLATCKRVIGRHGGRIWVDSHPGRGSTFWFTLPKIAKG